MKQEPWSMEEILWTPWYNWKIVCMCRERLTSYGETTMVLRLVQLSISKKKKKVVRNHNFNKTSSFSLKSQPKIMLEESKSYKNIN